MQNNSLLPIPEIEIVQYPTEIPDSGIIISSGIIKKFTLDEIKKIIKMYNSKNSNFEKLDNVQICSISFNNTIVWMIKSYIHDVEIKSLILLDELI